MNVSLGNDAFGGIVGGSMDNKPTTNETTEQRKTVSINTILREFDVPSTIDYFSLDVEGAEEMVMEHFPFDTYKINILTIERPSLVLQANLRANGYVFVEMIWYFGETLWVHQNIVDMLGLAKIKSVIQMNHSVKRPKKGYHVFDMATGEMKIMK